MPVLRLLWIEFLTLTSLQALWLLPDWLLKLADAVERLREL